MPKLLNLAAVQMTDEIITKNKELARRLGTNPRFVSDMQRGGFRMPCRLSQAEHFLQRHPHPTRFRSRQHDDED
jgi:hypothetical protein